MYSDRISEAFSQKFGEMIDWEWLYISATNRVANTKPEAAYAEYVAAAEDLELAQWLTYDEYLLAFFATDAIV